VFEELFGANEHFRMCMALYENMQGLFENCVGPFDSVQGLFENV